MSDTSLNDFDLQTREQALKSISEAGEFPEPSTLLNLHAHTFYSFNYKGFSPEYILRWRRNEGGIGSCRNRGL